MEWVHKGSITAARKSAHGGADASDTTVSPLLDGPGYGPNQPVGGWGVSLPLIVDIMTDHHLEQPLDRSAGSPCILPTQSCKYRTMVTSIL